MLFALASCGVDQSESFAVAEPVTTTTTTVVPSSSESLGEGRVTRDWSAEFTTMTLPPEGAYPVLTPEEAMRDDLAPGTYRIRPDTRKGWPEQCLVEMVVFPHPTEGRDLTKAQFDSMQGDPNLDEGDELSAADSEARTLARLERERELLDEVCHDYFAELENDLEQVITEPSRAADTTTP